MTLESLITELAEKAHAERKAMVQSARRSISQRLRYARERLRRFIKHGN